MQKPIKGYIPKKPIQPQPSLGGSIDSIVRVKDELEVLKNDLTSAVDTKIAEMDSSLSSFSEEAKNATQKINDKVAEFEQTAITLITDIHNIPQLQGTPGKDAAPVDEDKIVKNILSQIPQPQTIDENLIVKKVLQAIPKNKADLKIIQETFETDPMSVIEKIMAMPEGKFKLKTSHIDGLEQTMSAFRSQLGRGYLHGGGLSTVSHDSTLTGDGTPTNPLHVVSSATTEITGLIQPGTNITFTGTGTTLDPYIVNSTGGGGTPGGLNAQIQYNNNGVFGGISGATTDGTAVSLNAAHLLNPTINGAGTGLATLVYPNTSSSVTITVPATTGTLALTSQLTSGTVTSVATDATLTGGPITTTGTLGIDLTHANIWTGKLTVSTVPFVVSGNQTLAAWGLVGPEISVAAATLTDSSTAAGTTVTNAVANSIGIPTITAANATSGSKVTYTNASTLYIAGIPTLGLNTLATNMYALNVASGLVNMGGQLNVSSTINSSSFMTAAAGYFINGTNQGIESTNSSTNVSIRSGGVQNRLVIASTGFVGIGSITVPGVLTTSFGATAAAWGLNGINLQTTAQTFTDNSSAAGTVTNNMVNTFGIPTLATSVNVVTYTNAATVYIAGAPSAGAHVTLTNPYSLYVAAGNTFLGGHLNIEGITSTGATGTGKFVFDTSPTITGATLTTSSVNGVTLVNAGTATLYLSQDGTYTTPAGTYVLPTASTSVLGGVKVDGTSITISGGIISATTGGTGTVTSVSVVTANGVSGSVATATTTPAITLTLGAITPTSVNSVVISGSSTPTLAVTGTTTVSGSNTGDQTITLTGAVTGSGTGSFTTTIQSSIALPGNPTTTTQTPSDNSTKIATTAYVDAAVLGQNFKEAVGAATTANLVGVYLNGASGVGATFTYTATGVDTIDGVALTLGMRVLLKNQTTTFQNGIYTVTTAGAIGVAGILTRATDANQSSEWKTGDSVFVTAGTTLSTTTWAYTGIDSPTMGTTAITFVQTAGQGSSTAGNGIAITGNSIAIDTSVTVDKTTAQVLTNKDLTSGTNTFPTFNQNTSGSAASLTTARTIGIATGDATSAGSTFDGTANNTNALTLATVNANTGSFGSSTSIPNFTVNGKGLITAAGSNVVIAPAGTLTGTTLNPTVVTSSLTSVGTITTGVWNGTAIANANLANSAVTIGSTSVSLGATVTTFAGLVSVTSTSFVGALTGNASTVTTNANLTGVITSSGNATSIASQTGTGTKFVVDTSPTIVTPTIVSFTNATHNHTNSAGGGQLTDAALSSAVTVSKGGTGLTTTTAYGVIHAGTTATGNFQNSGTPGASGTVYTSTGTTSLPTWQAPTAPLATVKIATDFATSARFGTAITGAGTNSYGVGLDMNTGAGAGSIDSRERITEQGGAILGSPTLTISSISFQQVGTTVNYFFGLSNGVTVASTGITYTDKHIGFKLTASGTTLSLFATQADGTTENASAALVTFVATDEIDLIIHVNGTSSVDYYYRKNGGALSSATNLTSNMPTGAMNYAQYSVSNVNTTQRSEVIILGSCWER